MAWTATPRNVGPTHLRKHRDDGHVLGELGHELDVHLLDAVRRDEVDAHVDARVVVLVHRARPSRILQPTCLSASGIGAPSKLPLPYSGLGRPLVLPAAPTNKSS